jgi:hypothetical protein
VTLAWWICSLKLLSLSILPPMLRYELGIVGFGINILFEKVI